MSVSFYRHGLSGRDAQAVAKVLDTPFLTSGAVGRAVEAQMTEFFGCAEAMLTNSWTNGAVATLLALGIAPGDEVIVPAMTFIASANAAELLGAKVVFADVDPATLLLTPEAVAAKLTPRTKVVIPVHLYGQMCDMIGLGRVLNARPDISVIEDCAHCFEGSRGPVRPGSHGRAAIFSFYATKNVTCGEGGAIITNDSELAGRIRQTRLHGMSQGAIDRFREGQYRHWDMACMGVKANLPDILAALLPGEISAVRQRRDKRQVLAERYTRAFAGTGLRLPEVTEGVTHAWHLYTIGIPGGGRDDALSAMGKRGIGVAVNYRSVPTLTYYREKYGYESTSFPVSQLWGEQTLSLPFFPSMSEAEQDEVIAAVHQDIVPLCR